MPHKEDDLSTFSDIIRNLREDSSLRAFSYNASSLLRRNIGIGNMDTALQMRNWREAIDFFAPE